MAVYSKVLASVGSLSMRTSGFLVMSDTESSWAEGAYGLWVSHAATVGRGCCGFGSWAVGVLRGYNECCD